MNEMTAQLSSIFGSWLKEHEPISKHTNFRIGGPARWLAEVRTEEELVRAIQLAKENQVPFFVMGGGSNLLASDEGFSGLVLKMAMRNIRILPEPVEGNSLRPSTSSGRKRVCAEAGALSSALARATAEAGLAGLEWAISLPGTVGGAIRGNAGCHGGEMSDHLVSIRLFRDGSVVEVSKAELSFGYRESSIKQSKDVILAATFELALGDSNTLKQKMDGFLAKRKASQPLYAGSAGCIFKNVEVNSVDLERLKKEADIPEDMLRSGKISAGWLIEQLDLKGKSIGGAKISEEHGNFILNTGKATASDVVQLIAMAKMYARDRFGIVLKEEVEYLGF